MNEITTFNLHNAAFAREKLLEWYKNSARKFPWRYRSDPYQVIIAELMLRRTQARQVVPVYNKFINDFPDVRSLALASLEDLKEYLRPLGLSWRTANFEAMAGEIIERYAGKIPENRTDLLALPGVGPYVADAVRIFAFGEVATLADTNTVRVAARYFGFDYNQESRRKQSVIGAVSLLVDHKKPAESNYALLDFAAIVCKSLKPEHSVCPLSEHCIYFKTLQDSKTE